MMDTKNYAMGFFPLNWPWVVQHKWLGFLLPIGIILSVKACTKQRNFLYKACIRACNGIILSVKACTKHARTCDIKVEDEIG